MASQASVGKSCSLKTTHRLAHRYTIVPCVSGEFAAVRFKPVRKRLASGKSRRLSQAISSKNAAVDLDTAHTPPSSRATAECSPGQIIEAVVKDIDGDLVVLTLPDGTPGLLSKEDVTLRRQPEDLSALFSSGDTVVALAVQRVAGTMRLSTEALEAEPGLMLTHKQLVYDQAKEWMSRPGSWQEERRQKLMNYLLHQHPLLQVAVLVTESADSLQLEELVEAAEQNPSSIPDAVEAQSAGQTDESGAEEEHGDGTVHEAAQLGLSGDRAPETPAVSDAKGNAAGSLAASPETEERAAASKEGVAVAAAVDESQAVEEEGAAAAAGIDEGEATSKEVVEAAVNEVPSTDQVALSVSESDEATARERAHAAADVSTAREGAHAAADEGDAEAAVDARLPDAVSSEELASDEVASKMDPSDAAEADSHSVEHKVPAVAAVATELQNGQEEHSGAGIPVEGGAAESTETGLAGDEVKAGGETRGAAVGGAGQDSLHATTTPDAGVSETSGHGPVVADEREASRSGGSSSARTKETVADVYRRLLASIRKSIDEVKTEQELEEEVNIMKLEAAAATAAAAAAENITDAGSVGEGEDTADSQDISEEQLAAAVMAEMEIGHNSSSRAGGREEAALVGRTKSVTKEGAETVSRSAEVVSIEPQGASEVAQPLNEDQQVMIEGMEDVCQPSEMVSNRDEVTGNGFDVGPGTTETPVNASQSASAGELAARQDSQHGAHTATVAEASEASAAEPGAQHRTASESAAADDDVSSVQAGSVAQAVQAGTEAELSHAESHASSVGDQSVSPAPAPSSIPHRERVSDIVDSPVLSVPTNESTPLKRTSASMGHPPVVVQEVDVDVPVLSALETPIPAAASASSSSSGNSGISNGGSGSDPVVSGIKELYLELIEATAGLDSPAYQQAQEATSRWREARVMSQLSAVEVVMDARNPSAASTLVTQPTSTSQLPPPPLLQVGDVATGEVIKIVPYGAFVQVAPGITALLHITQVSQQRVRDMADVFSVGETVRALVFSTSMRQGIRRVLLSTKKLEQRPGDMLRERTKVYQEADKVACQFQKLWGVEHPDGAEQESSRTFTLANGHGGRNAPNTVSEGQQGSAEVQAPADVGMPSGQHQLNSTSAGSAAGAVLREDVPLITSPDAGQAALAIMDALKHMVSINMEWVYQSPGAQEKFHQLIARLAVEVRLQLDARVLNIRKGMQSLLLCRFAGYHHFLVQLNHPDSDLIDQLELMVVTGVLSAHPNVLHDLLWFLYKQPPPYADSVVEAVKERVLLWSGRRKPVPPNCLRAGMRLLAKAGQHAWTAALDPLDNCSLVAAEDLIAACGRNGDLIPLTTMVNSVEVRPSASWVVTLMDDAWEKYKDGLDTGVREGLKEQLREMCENMV